MPKYINILMQLFDVFNARHPLSSQFGMLGILYKSLI